MTPPGGERGLTAGEAALVRGLFGEAIDTSVVRIRRRRWWWLQPRRVVMAPCGHIHFAADSPDWRDDFSEADIGLQGLFLHEMAHVWQAQEHGRRYLPLHRHPFCRYAYRLEAGKPFSAYGIEQQAEICRHLFLARTGQRPQLSELEALVPFT